MRIFWLQFKDYLSGRPPGIYPFTLPNGIALGQWTRPRHQRLHRQTGGTILRTGLETRTTETSALASAGKIAAITSHTAARLSSYSPLTGAERA
jgi:hypothetical protein